MLEIMGHNRRYGSDLTDAAIAKAVLRPQPISLTPAEVGAEKVPPASSPVDVEAWVRFPEASVARAGTRDHMDGSCRAD